MTMFYYQSTQNCMKILFLLLKKKETRILIGMTGQFVLGSWHFERMFTLHHLSHVRCQVSGVRCQVSGVRCQASFFFLPTGGTSGLKVCYQRYLHIGTSHFLFWINNHWFGKIRRPFKSLGINSNIKLSFIHFSIPLFSGVFVVAA